MLARPDRKANGGSAGGGTRRPSSPHGRYLICSARVRRRLADYGEQNDIDLCGYAYGWDGWPTSRSAWSACSTSPGQDHSGGAGIVETYEQVIFPPFPCDRYPAAGHPLPDLPAHRGVPARQPQRGPDRALPPGPSRSARCPFPVALRRLPALPRVPSPAPIAPGRPCVSRAGGRQRSRSAATPPEGPRIEPPYG